MRAASFGLAIIAQHTRDFMQLKTFLCLLCFLAIFLPPQSHAVPSQMQLERERARQKYQDAQRMRREREEADRKISPENQIPKEILLNTPTSPVPEGLRAPRYWTTQSGARLPARFSNFELGWLVLENRDRQRIGIKAARLSSEDQQFLLEYWPEAWSFLEMTAPGTNELQKAQIPRELLDSSPVSTISDVLADYRDWTSKSGLKVRAKVQNFDQGWLVFQNEDLQKFGLPAELLSEPDRQFLSEQWGAGWTYTQMLNEISDETSFIASVNSLDRASFGFPYHGGALTLQLRHRPKTGDDVLIRIPSGQFLNHPVTIRFDENPPFRNGTTEPSDYSTNLLFLDGEKRLIDFLKHSHTMKIEVEFFQEGRRTFTFDISGLIWPE